jgi:hypothetical protein
MTTQQHFEIYMGRRVQPKTVIKYRNYLIEIRVFLGKENMDYLYGLSSIRLIDLRKDLLRKRSFRERTQGTQETYLVAYDWLIEYNEMIERNRIQKVEHAA